MKLRVLIVDDEAPARQRIEGLLRADGNAEIVGSIGDPDRAIDAIRGDTTDLVFLDVQMPRLSGFDVIQQVGPAAMPAVIFVAAFDRSDVLKNDVPTISVDIEAVVLEMRGRQIADDKMCVVATQLDSRRPNGVSDVGLLKRLPRLEFDEERAASFV